MFLAQAIFMTPGLVIFELMEGAGGTNLDAMDTYPWITLLVQGGGTVGSIFVIYLLWRYLNKGTLKEIGFRGPLKDLGFGQIGRASCRERVWGRGGEVRVERIG